MILAHLGIETTETELIEAAAMEPGGLNPTEIAQLSRKYGLQAHERQLEREALFDLIKRERFPIAMLYRRPIDAVDAGHAVIPIAVSHRYVTLLDPLRGKRRVAIRKFEQARRLVGQWAIAWEPAASS
jgi:ABC-type bacteriocin/lantibiotic exporter with double-glycine peptidase domain